MRICIVCPRLCHGGAERVAVSLANGFVGRGHEVIFFANLHEEQTYILDAAVQVQNLAPQTSNKLSKWGGAIKCLRKKLKKDHPDMVIGVMGMCSFVAKLGTIGLDIPVIATEHNSFERPMSAPMTTKSYFCKFYVNKLYNHVTVLTSADKFFIGSRLKYISVMPNPLFLSQLQGKPIRDNTILAAGRLDDWHYKGFDVLIKSFAKLLNGSKVAEPRSRSKSNDIAFKMREDGWKLQIAGTGSEENLNYLKQLSKENRIEDSVEFLGFRKDVEKLYQKASIFVLSSRYEGFGLVLIEAMSQGCACVACDYKGRQREILNPTNDQPSETRNLSPDARLCRFRSYDGERTQNIPVETCETGILCEPDNVEALADAMAKMIEDDDYRESVRAKAIERSKYYSIENTMERWESLLKRITETTH